MRNSRQDTDTLSLDLFCMRGIGILFVVVVHVLGVDALHGIRKLFLADRADLRISSDLIHSFNMAVMLMGSGVAVAAFGRADVSLRDFLRKKVTRLLVPMLVWAPVLFLMQEVLRSKPQGLQGWLQVLVQLPGTWFPPYSIFWFVHALAGATLLAWLWRRFVTPRLGRWSEAGYFGVSVLLFLAVSPWAQTAGSELVSYLELILYWNRYFALGLLVFPWLAPVRRGIQRQSLAIQVLLPTVFLAIITLVYVVLPLEQYEVVRTINGPLGFGLLFSLVVLMRHQGAEGTLWKYVWGRLTFVGSISMSIYIFHLYFVVASRVALERLLPETMAAPHVVLGILAGCVGPWLISVAFKGVPLFHWTLGQSMPAPKARVVQETPREELPVLPLTTKM